MAESLHALSGCLHSLETRSTLHFERRLLPEWEELVKPFSWLWRTTLQVAVPAQLLEAVMSYRKRWALR